MQQIIKKGQAPLEANVSEGHTMVEIMVPGTKVGLVIGKGGETIKQLQVRFHLRYKPLSVKKNI